MSAVLKQFEVLNADRASVREELPFTAKTQKLSWFCAVSLAVGALVYFAFYLAFYSAYPADDAYIHLRIARHFAEAGVPYYNIGERVNGSSSLLWTVLLCALFKLFGASAVILPVLEWALIAGVFAVCVELLRERFAPPIAVMAAFVVVSSFLLNVAALWMETPAALLFFLLSIFSLRRESFLWAGVFAGLAFLTRLELALWFVIAFLFTQNASQKKLFFTGVAPFLLFYMVFNGYFFGSLLPNTISAKSRVYHVNFQDFWFFLHVTPLIGLYLFGFCVLQFFLLLERKSSVWVFPTSLVSTILLFLYFSRGTMMFQWYLPLILLPLALTFLMTRSSKRVYIVLHSALGGFILSSWTSRAISEGVGLVQNRPAANPESLSGERVRQYQRIGDLLYRRYPNATLMTSEIGGLGWTYKGEILDSVGLVSPRFLKYHPMAVPEDRATTATGAIPPGAVHEAQPDLIVSMQIFSQAFRRDFGHGRFPEYQLWKRFPVVDFARPPGTAAPTVFGSAYTEVYIHRRLQTR